MATETIAIDWQSRGAVAAVRPLVRALRDRPARVVVHYSHLAWSRHGLPFGFLGLLALCRIRAPVITWVHDPDRVAGPLARHRLASALKARAMRLAIRIGGSGVVTVPPSHIYWATPRISSRLVLCPSPSNIGSAERNPPSDMFTVSSFGLQIATRAWEAEPLLHVSRGLVDEIGPFRLRLLGATAERGTPTHLLDRLREVGVECDAPGFLPAEELRQRLANSHAFVMVRGGLTTRSGTLAAALSCELPVVGMAGSETAAPITDAGIICVEHGDWPAMSRGLALLARDSALQAELSRKSKRVVREHYSWKVVADRLARLVNHS